MAHEGNVRAQGGSHLDVCSVVGSTTRKHEAHRPAAFFGAPCCSSNAARSSSNSMPCISMAHLAWSVAVEVLDARHTEHEHMPALPHLCLLPISVHAVLCGFALRRRHSCMVCLGHNQGIVIWMDHKFPWRVAQPSDLRNADRAYKKCMQPVHATVMRCNCCEVGFQGQA